MSMITALLMLSAPAASCQGPSVVMVVAGPTHDALRMRAYGEAIAKSGLYQKLGGYYLNVPRPIATFEGEAAKNHTLLMVRFPCLANAKAFWNSREYQEKIKRLRLDPPAGDYLVTVYAEAATRADMLGKVSSSAYLQRFDASSIEQVAAEGDNTNKGLSAGRILERAINVAGGDTWLNPKTLVLRGRAAFYGPTGSEPRTTADDYRMWRVFDSGRTVSHGAEGKVLIRARAGDRTLFEAAYDGETTWTERGVTPKAEADAFWASNFGFGILRHATKPGFKLERIGDDNQAGHLLYKLRLTDAHGEQTLFGIDQQSHAIRTMEFATPRGWHKRTYEDFVELKNPRWLQARKVTLYYNGVKQNEVYWSDAQVNVSVDEAIFRYTPAK